MEQITAHGGSDVSIVLVATKIDLPIRAVSTEEGKTLAKHYGVGYFETSAKDNKNVTEAFTTLAKEAIEMHNNIKSSQMNLSHKLGRKNFMGEEKKSCC